MRHLSPGFLPAGLLFCIPLISIETFMTKAQLGPFLQNIIETNFFVKIKKYISNNKNKHFGFCRQEIN